MKKILVHLHIYYKEQTDMFAKKINSSLNRYDYDLFVTIREHDEEIEQKFLSFKPDTEFVITENIGADIYPFTYVLNLINLEDYDYLVKLHTKKIYDKFEAVGEFNKYKVPFKYWNEYLISFLSPHNMKKIIKNFKQNKNLGMVANYRLIANESTNLPKSCKIAYDAAKELIEKQNIHCENLIYPAGTMFVARASIFNLVKQLNLNASNFQEFSSYAGKPVSIFPYAMERFIGNCANANGLLTKDVYTPKLQIFMLDITLQINSISSFIFSIRRVGEKKIKVVKIFNITIKELDKGKL